jgi:hypothetical protein
MAVALIIRQRPWSSTDPHRKHEKCNGEVMENAESEGEVPDQQMITIIVIRWIFPFALLARYPAAVSGDATTRSGYQQPTKQKTILKTGPRQGAHDCNFVIVWLRPSHEGAILALSAQRDFTCVDHSSSCWFVAAVAFGDFFVALRVPTLLSALLNRNALSQKKKEQKPNLEKARACQKAQSGESWETDEWRHSFYQLFFQPVQPQ